MIQIVQIVNGKRNGKRSTRKEISLERNRIESIGTNEKNLADTGKYEIMIVVMMILIRQKKRGGEERGENTNTARRRNERIVAVALAVKDHMGAKAIQGALSLHTL